MYSSSSTINMSHENKFRNMLLSESDNQNTMTVSTEKYNMTFSELLADMKKSKYNNSVFRGGANATNNKATNNKAIDILNSNTSVTSNNMMSQINNDSILNSETSDMQICD